MLHNNSKEKGVTENTFFVWHKQSRYENTLIIVALKYKIKVGSDVILLDFDVPGTNIFPYNSTSFQFFHSNDLFKWIIYCQCNHQEITMILRT